MQLIGMGSLEEAFSGGHGRLAEQLESAIAALDTGGDREWQVLTAFVGHLREHIHCEEDIVFPALDYRLPSLRHVTLKLRREHDAFCSILTDVEERIQHGDVGATIADLRELGVALRLHERRESAELCPLVEGCLSQGEVEELVVALVARG